MVFLSHAILRKPAVKQNSLLLDLPLGLIYYIFDGLQWPEKVTLSQTCRDLWYQLRQKCSLVLHGATARERLEYLTMLGGILPDHYLCVGCCALHLLDPRDIPITSCDRHGSNMYRSPCPLPEPLWSRHRLHPCYAVAFRHVQLATKLSRMKGVHQRYLECIMQRFVVTNPRLYSIRMDFVAEPIIVRGRYILMTTFEFYHGVEEVSYSNLVQTEILFCPHHSTGTLNDPSDDFIKLIRSAFHRSSDAFGFCQDAYSCGRCPSDYSIEIKYNRAIISVWHDLGTGVSPEDPYWRSHIWDKENNLFKGTEFQYEHGSIKRMYYSSGA